ncbi:MAG: ABC transporter substrate-binding protein, partial [Chloroflexota bacterium]|nr:ABC transporter substrate-binding protein [Chloroflexota bacterium]
MAERRTDYGASGVSKDNGSSPERTGGPTSSGPLGLTRRRFVRLAAGGALAGAVGLPALLAACGGGGGGTAASPSSKPASAAASPAPSSSAARASSAAASKPAAAGQPQRGGILKVVENAEGGAPIGVPWQIQGIDTKLPKPAIETLLRETPKGEYVPWLAEKWNVDTAKKTITLTLRQGVKFQDGTDFNAEAVKWNFQHAVTAKASEAVTHWKSFDVVDDHTLRINADIYRNDFLNTLSGFTTSGMISPTAFDKNGLDWAKSHPVGTGPFKLKTFERGSKLEFEKWDGYWKKGLPYLDGVQYLFIRDAMTQQAAMQTKGEQRVDVLSSTSGQQAATMKSLGLVVLSMPVGPVSLIPDSKDADSPLSKLQVRKAISYAIDRDAIVKARGFGYWQPAFQVPNVNTPGYVSSYTGEKYDPAKAKQLLSEAGFASGFKTTIVIMPALVDKDAMTAVQRYLGAVGIQVDLQTPDNGGYTKMRFGGGWKNGFLAQHTRDLATFNITYGFYMPEVTKQFPPLKRPAGLLDKLAESQKTASPEAKLGEDLTKMLIDDETIIPIYYVNEMYILQPNVHD